MNHPGAALRAVIFDLDGTLVDTADDFVPVVQQLRAEYGLPAMDPARIRGSVSNGSRALVRLAFSMEEDEPGFDARRQRLLTLYGDQLGRFARPYEGIRELLAGFEARDIAWGIATNKPRAYTMPLLAMLALKPAAGSVICPDDVEQPKPHPESLYRGCADLNCDPAQAIYVGDHQRDIDAGRAAGTYTVAAAYGYIEDGDDPLHWGADATVQHSEELAGILLREEEPK